MKYILIFILTTSFIYAQNLDSLYNAVISLHQHETNIKTPNSITTNNPPIKCGFGIIADVKRHFNDFTTEQQNNIQNVLERPILETSIVSPSGRFRIHYDRTGYNAPDYFNGIANTVQLSVDSLAMAFDSAYFFEVNYLGFDPPPSDDGDGGDDLYDVYISNLGYYGVTNWTSNNVGKNVSFIQIDNQMSDPNNFFTKGINAARVTAAHEFHHAIQVGSYSDNTEGNTYYFEITSTSMEEFVFDSVNDYYGYLSGYFKNPDRRFTYFDGSSNGGGYDRAIWNIFLKEKFEKDGDSKKGFDIIKRSWELMRNNQNSAIEAISLALSENGLSLKNTFAEFSQWVYFTGYRTKQNKYFSEANNYPLVKPIATYKYQGPKKTYMMSLKPMAHNYIVFDLSSSGINDTLVSIISNCDLKNADIYPYTGVNYDYSLLTANEDGSNQIITGYYSKLVSDKMEYLKESDVFNNEVVNGATLVREEVDFAFPQPFNYSKNQFVFFPTKTNEYGIAKLAIYSTSMNLIYNGQLPIYAAEKIIVRWDGKDNNGKKAASGIYIFVTDSDGEIITGKIAIIN
ncbi:MAG: hypothetical protein KKF62_04455 [Bacteroidetes bacterium]|nr:hypothetical protein [Bacteroidota bacterium]MBU1116683.1 hypothetical protein [Bacteroidota bacterium]MBU1800048.1 hypothetical protein [Bacteroidota bacterium]